jgi:hypothetical protein
LANGAEADATCYGKIMLHTAAKKGFTEVAGTLIEHHANVNVLGPNSETALHIALKERAIGVVRLLLAHPDIRLSIQNTGGQTPLDVAEKNRHQLPEWIFSKFIKMDAPRGELPTVTSKIVAGGSDCNHSGGGVPIMTFN